MDVALCCTYEYIPSQYTIVEDVCIFQDSRTSRLYLPRTCSYHTWCDTCNAIRTTNHQCLTGGLRVSSRSDTAGVPRTQQSYDMSSLSAWKRCCAFFMKLRLRFQVSRHQRMIHCCTYYEQY